MPQEEWQVERHRSLAMAARRAGAGRPRAPRRTPRSPDELRALLLVARRLSERQAHRLRAIDPGSTSGWIRPMGDLTAGLADWRAELRALKTVEDPVELHLRVASVVTTALAAAAIHGVVVGGTAAEFYSAGGYLTRDVDIVLYGPVPVEIMEALGVTRRGSAWVHDGLPVSSTSPRAPSPATMAGCSSCRSAATASG